MKLEIARGLFLMGALGVASLCAAAWHEPDSSVVKANNGLGYCPAPPSVRLKQADIRPDQDLLLFMYSLSQGMRPSG
ncbi:hypothetical protein [Stutzerimonas azotifigens]|uniref:Uncharacterized protein n=1 Tax=Stutzerimonas azotifigens TaxID=291995 RepID=A0ABR5YWK8_9GAMM|nr:hypothetical protein [Stutzerimonas azotifigens]MBA1272307.1 hypothetical protein [Stutzerimonas azotifigens]